MEDNRQLTQGSLVIVATGQAGTVLQNVEGTLYALLRNGDIWTGPPHQCRPPQDAEDLKAARLHALDKEPPRRKRGQ